MDRFVLLELEGDLQTVGLQATLEIISPTAIYPLKVKGELPPNPELATCLEWHWQQKYRALGETHRIKGQKIVHKGSIHKQIAECQESAQQLREQLRQWLAFPAFQSIDRCLREEFNRDDPIRFLIRATDCQLQKIPWQEWDFFERYPRAEVAFCHHTVPASPVEITRPSARVRILAILGHSSGINVEVDRKKLEALPDATVEFLVEPDREVLSDRLWEQSWDILFFAGHSETEGHQGRIHINPTDSFSLSELKFGLRQAIERGLQLAIFNSCDGLGLVQELESLQIPQTIVMREPVADRVAQSFLQYFLAAYASGESLYLATRQARERLQALEGQFPCASWLPTICQNPMVVPPQWHQLHQQHPTFATRPRLPLPEAAPVPHNRHHSPFVAILLTGFAVAGTILGIRSTGLLESVELAAYDRQLRSRPPELIDSRLLVVEITEADIEALGGYPLADGTLAQAIDHLAAHQPAAIGLDVHRYKPREPGRSDFIAQFQHPNLIGVCAFEQDANFAPPPELTDEQVRSQLGFSNLAIDDIHTKTVRRQVLSYDPNLAAAPSRCTTPYSLSFQLAYRFLQQHSIPIQVSAVDRWQFGSVTFQPLSQRTGGYQRLDNAGNQIMLNYRNGKPAQRLNLQQVLDDDFQSAWVRDRIILIGYTAPVARDNFSTPYGTMPGVWVHAHAIGHLLSTTLDGRPTIQAVPVWVEIPWVLGWALAGSGLAWKGRSRRLLALLAIVILTVGLDRGCVMLLVWGIWMPTVPAAIALWLAWGLGTISSHHSVGGLISKNHISPADKDEVGDA